MSFQEHSFPAVNSESLHRLVYSEWGLSDARPLICVHGLTGNGHDFDYLARELIKSGYRLIAIDLAGRGRSDFLPNPLDYNYNQYCQDLMMLLTTLDLTKPRCVDWLGISLGGLLGLKLAGMEGSPVRRLIINDVGPEVPQEALDYIYDVIAQSYRFDDLNKLEARMRQTRGLSWGPITDEQWRFMAEHNARALDKGGVTYAYDPMIAEVFKTEPTGALDLWPYWDKISCPVLVIRGGQSPILTEDILVEMQRRGPDFDLVTFEDCGHVPSLMAPEQIKEVEQWLNKKPIS